MILADNLSALDVKGAIVTIGNFDGVHRGHRMLLEHVRERSKATGRSSVVITFFPPTRVFFYGAHFLSSDEEKRALLSPFEPAAIVTIPFNHSYAQTDRAVFIDQLRRLAPHTIVVGEDFRFGHRRAGNLNDLSLIASRLEVFGLKVVEGEVVSSSRIRKHLAAGRIEEANRLLGYPYLAIGRVTQGKSRGRTIGFPTANVVADERKALPLGVFAVTARIGSKTYKGMANAGPRPSFPDAPPSLEVHLFCDNLNLYGRTIETSFHAHLRGQLRFHNLEALKAQLKQDRDAAKAVLQP